MYLKDLLADIDFTATDDAKVSSLEISDITYDSRLATADKLFVCLIGRRLGRAQLRVRGVFLRVQGVHGAEKARAAVRRRSGDCGGHTRGSGARFGGSVRVSGEVARHNRRHRHEGQDDDGVAFS